MSVAATIWAALPVAWTPFIHPILMDGRMRLAMLILLALSIAVVYRTIRCQRVREVPLSAAVLCGEIVIGMFLVGVGLWGVYLLAM